MSAFRASFEVALDPDRAFDVVVDELALAGAPLEREGTGAWEPGQRIVVVREASDWEPRGTTEIELRFAAVDGGTRITLECRGFDEVLGDRGSELAGWFAGEALAPLLGATSPDRFGDWLTDRRARRPSGAEAREVYADPLYHYPNFAVILDPLVARERRARD